MFVNQRVTLVPLSLGSHFDHKMLFAHLIGCLHLVSTCRNIVVSYLVTSCFATINNQSVELSTILTMQADYIRSTRIPQPNTIYIFIGCGEEK